MLTLCYFRSLICSPNAAVFDALFFAETVQHSRTARAFPSRNATAAVRTFSVMSISWFQRWLEQRALWSELPPKNTNINLVKRAWLES